MKLRHGSYLLDDFLVLSPLKMWHSDVRCYMVARVCPWMLGNAVRPGLLGIYQSCWKGHSNSYGRKQFDVEHAIAIGYSWIGFSLAMFLHMFAPNFCNRFSTAWMYLSASDPMIPNDSTWVAWSGLLIAYITFHRLPNSGRLTAESLDMPLPAQLLLEDTGETRMYLQPGLGV